MRRNTRRGEPVSSKGHACLVEKRQVRHGESVPWRTGSLSYVRLRRSRSGLAAVIKLGGVQVTKFLLTSLIQKKALGTAHPEKNRSLNFYCDLLSVSFARYSATTRSNSRRTKLERLRSCLAASSSIASKRLLETLLIVSI